MKHGDSGVERQISVQGIHLSAFIFGKVKEAIRESLPTTKEYSMPTILKIIYI